jgi:LmbE family N-acetylglucosaminyl deacetylase
VQLRISVY